MYGSVPQPTAGSIERCALGQQVATVPRTFRELIWIINILQTELNFLPGSLTIQNEMNASRG
jgi:hypothetical protein